MPDGHSEVEPPLPIPNRIVKRPSADDSAGPGVKVGHRQAMYTEAPYPERCGAFLYLDVGNSPVQLHRASILLIIIPMSNLCP